jgi:hypothetical protein
MKENHCVLQELWSGCWPVQTEDPAARPWVEATTAHATLTCSPLWEKNMLAMTLVCPPNLSQNRISGTLNSWLCGTGVVGNQIVLMCAQPTTPLLWCLSSILWSAHTILPTTVPNYGMFENTGMVNCPYTYCIILHITSEDPSDWHLLIVKTY